MRDPLKMTSSALFHWKPWRPVHCIGGRVWFGWYYAVSWLDNGRRVSTFQTPAQFKIKRSMGVIL